MSIGSRIKEIRKEAEMTQKQFAEAIGMKQSPLSQIESDKILPSIETIKTIIRKFNTTYEFIIDGDEKKNEILIEEVAFTKLDINTKSLVSKLVTIINNHKNEHPTDIQMDSLVELEAFVQNVVDKRIIKLENIIKKLLNTVDQKIFEEEIKGEIEKSDERLKKNEGNLTEITAKKLKDL